MRFNMRRLEIILLLIVTFLVIFMLCMMFLPSKLYAGEIHGELSFGYIGEDQDYCTEFVLSCEFSIVILQGGIETLMEQSPTTIFLIPIVIFIFSTARSSRSSISFSMSLTHAFILFTVTISYSTTNLRAEIERLYLLVYGGNMSDFEQSFQQLIDSAVEKAFLKHIDKMNHHNTYLTVTEVVERLKISPQQVHNLINNHGLPYKRFGNRVIRIPEDEFEKWQENRSQYV